MDTLLQDSRYAVRTLLRSPGFAAVAVLTLGLGIGANAAVFSLVNAVFLRPLPAVTAPDRLVRVFGGGRGQNGSNPLSYPDFQELSAGSGRAFSAVAATGGVNAVREGDVPTTTRAVTGNYFGMMGLRPALGRPITVEDDQAAARPVAVVSHALWTRELGGAPDVLGRTLRLNGQSFTIVGVAPEGFHGTEVEALVEVWVPMRQVPLLRPDAPGVLADRGTTWLLTMARLRPGVSLEAAAASLQPLATGLRQRYPEGHKEFRFRVFPGGTLVSAAGAPQVVVVFTLLMVMVGGVLCVACANVANLLLSRAAARRREIAVRLSLGAGRGRLVRQFLTESLVLAVAGGVLGLAIAQLAPGLFRMLEMPATFVYAVDGRVLVHAGVVTLVTAALFGLAPAFQAVRGISLEALKDSNPGGGRVRSRLRSVLTASQVALSLALLVSAALVLRSLWAMQAARVPYQESRVVVSNLDGGAPGAEAVRRRAALERLVAAAGEVPGVESAAVATVVPMGNGVLQAEWSDPVHPERTVPVVLNAVSRGYFQVMGMPARAGRLFGEADRAGGAPVAVVSRALAGRMWPGRNPVGMRLRSDDTTPVDYEVVGVVDDVVFSMAESARPGVYVVWEQSELPVAALHLRMRPGATALEPAIRRASAEAGVELFGLRTLEEVRRETAFPQRLTGVLLGVFGAIAVVLAAVGLYGVVGYGVAQRTREIGVRVALGARPGQVRRLIVRQGMRMAGVGVGVGVLIALGLGQLMRGLLFGVSATDPVTFAAVATLLLVVSAAASWIPARRAAALEPMRALRSE
jgi:putative ABC transport system permease protein